MRMLRPSRVPRISRKNARNAIRRASSSVGADGCVSWCGVGMRPQASLYPDLLKKLLPRLRRSDPRREPDGDAGARLDRGGEEIVRGRGLGAMREREVAVRELVGAELLDGLAERAPFPREALGL